jgi:hypothetical protein
MTTFEAWALRGASSDFPFPPPSAVVAELDSCVSELVASSPPQPATPVIRAIQRTRIARGVFIRKVLYR